MLEQLLDKSWLNLLKPEFDQPYFQELLNFIQEEKKKGHLIYPEEKLIFNALNSCPFDQVKVIILGQDPYHGAGQANGLAFSVAEGMAIPPSLRNIYKELQSDLGILPKQNGNLKHWANQGVLLLNTSLTVRANEAASHQKYGWEQFTNQIINLLSKEKSGLVFLLWGNAAQKKAALVNPDKHLVLKAAHPSPLSAYNGFFGSRHFSLANNYLQQRGRAIIQW